MKIWELKSDLEGYQTFQLVNFEEGYKEYFDSKFKEITPLNKDWRDVYIETADEGLESDLPHFWGGVGVPVVSESAKNILEQLIGNQVEFLALLHNQQPYYAIHTLNAIDAVDYEKSSLRKLKSGLVVGLEKHAFIHERVKNQHIFKVYLSKRIYSPVTFVSDEFRHCILENKLKGFEFKEVWDSEKTE